MVAMQVPRLRPTARTLGELRRFYRPILKGDDAVLSAVRDVVTYPPQSNVLGQGDSPKVAHVLLEGYACRHLTLRDGRRQIAAVLVPGDACDLDAVMHGQADYGVNTLTKCVLGRIPANLMMDERGAAAQMTQAILRRLLRDQRITRELTVSLGRRSAVERLAHLFCELWVRMQAVGLARGDGFELRMTQSEMADMLGLSTIHTIRSLKQIRESGLAHFKAGNLTIFDHAGLEKLAKFDPAYLRMATA